jgi:hypothetical protein
MWVRVGADGMVWLSGSVGGLFEEFPWFLLVAHPVPHLGGLAAFAVLQKQPNNPLRVCPQKARRYFCYFN